MFRFANGHVSFRSRYVQTERLQREREARRRLYGHYRNKFTDDESVSNLPQRDNTGNTNAFNHHGALYMLREDSHPYRMDPETLDTLEVGQFGNLGSTALTAHPKIDPRTGEWWSYGVFARGDLSVKYGTLINNVAGQSDGMPGYGGGAFARGSVTLMDATIGGNIASHTGGALFAADGASALLVQDTIWNNYAANVGGAYLKTTDSIGVYNSTIASNTAATVSSSLAAGLALHAVVPGRRCAPSLASRANRRHVNPL